MQLNAKIIHPKNTNVIYKKTHICITPILLQNIESNSTILYMNVTDSAIK